MVLEHSTQNWREPHMNKCLNLETTDQFLIPIWMPDKWKNPNNWARLNKFMLKPHSRFILYMLFFNCIYLLLQTFTSLICKIEEKKTARSIFQEEEAFNHLPSQLAWFTFWRLYSRAWHLYFFIRCNIPHWHMHTKLA